MEKWLFYRVGMKIVRLKAFFLTVVVEGDCLVANASRAVFKTSS